MKSISLLVPLVSPIISWNSYGNIGTASSLATSSLSRGSASETWMADSATPFDERFQFYEFEAMELAGEGKLLQAAGAYRRAADLAMQSSIYQHRRSSILFQLADLYDAMGYVPEQIATLNLLISENDENGSGVLLYEEADSYDTASSLRQGVLKTAKERLANVLVDGLGDREAALQLYRDIEESAPMATALLRHGNLVAFEGDFNESVRCHVKALQLDNRIADIVLYLQLGAAVLGKPVTEHVSMYTEELQTISASTRELPQFMKASLDYVLSCSSGSLASSPWIHASTYDMLHLGMNAARKTSGLVLEFGVFHGKTIRMIAQNWQETTVHGFDTFQGIPETWNGEPAGSYSTYGQLPLAPDNVEYHVGLFGSTLAPFLLKHDGPVRFINIDCDLYSSTVDIFDALHGRIIPGTVLVFDEYVMHPNWRNDEFLAFQEAVKKYDWNYEYLGISLVSKQAVVRILA